MGQFLKCWISIWFVDVVSVITLLIVLRAMFLRLNEDVIGRKKFQTWCKVKNYFVES
jgi:hypothetical protein